MVGLRYLENVATLRLFEEKCVGCGMCLAVCPHAVFALEGKKARVLDLDACMECGACAMNCPTGAIEVDAGVGCATGILSDVLQKFGVGGECCECKPAPKGAPANCCGPSAPAPDETQGVPEGGCGCSPGKPSVESSSKGEPCCPQPPTAESCCPEPPEGSGEGGAGGCCSGGDDSGCGC